MVWHNLPSKKFLFNQMDDTKRIAENKYFTILPNLHTNVDKQELAELISGEITFWQHPSTNYQD